jgi:hypothetical protein
MPARSPAPPGVGVDLDEVERVGVACVLAEEVELLRWVGLGART